MSDAEIQMMLDDIEHIVINALPCNLGEKALKTKVKELINEVFVHLESAVEGSIIADVWDKNIDNWKQCLVVRTMHTICPYMVSCAEPGIINVQLSIVEENYRQEGPVLIGVRYF